MPRRDGNSASHNRRFSLPTRGPVPKEFNDRLHGAGKFSIIHDVKTFLPLLAALLPLALASAPITPERAVGIASDFVSRHPSRGHAASPQKARARMRPSSSPSGRTRTCSENGTNMFHLVSLDGGGFVTVSADDSTRPVLGFSASGELPDCDAGNPFWALVGGDVDASRGMRRRRGRKRHLEFADRNVSKATRLRYAAAATPSAASPASSVDDVRVAPLVKSKWNQSKVGGKKVYNYYVPNGYTCGCVATAMAQIMRYHRFPSSVAPQSFTCYLGSGQTPTNITMVGGTYDWDAMPLEPNSSVSDAEREMIGRICFDAGVSARMRYGMNGSGSGALAAYVHDPFKSAFGYASAESYFSGEGSIAGDIVESAILANLDAGYPVLLGICHVNSNGDAYNGHAIVADGYGYDDGTLYCHLNMGWSGSDDYWYALPNIGTSYGFNTVDSVVYNIFPTNTGQLVTGRVTDPYGNSMDGVVVAADIKRSKRPWLPYRETSTTDANGIYAAFTPYQATISAEYEGWASEGTAITTETSRSPVDIDWETGDCSIPGGEFHVGNSWGNDIVVGNANGANASVASLSPATGGQQSESPALSLSLSGTAGSWYNVERTYELNDPQWETVESFIVPSAGSKSVSLPVEYGIDSAFYRVVPKTAP